VASRAVTDEARPTLSRSQAARRSRVLRAAIDLAAEGGYDAVQMRDLSTRADVALGTIYRYFSSKDHVLASVWVDWMEDLRARVTRKPPQGGTPAERVLEVLGRACRAIERQPEVTAALVTALSASDPMVIECQRQTTAMTDDVLGAALPEIDAVTRQRIIRVLGHVWFSALVGWVNGWSGIDDISAELEVATHLLLDHRS
jgi:TetR/AcrR family transcriptional regulator, cholesterol catabolism regulator